ncbi:unnamed protein product [Bursaphelenchus okinawaensis]|uniref:TASOR PIN domain-containing protein n=1 Tax=Bursaphelenchus okinawaensis TaxID=465554 RepID=A0A811KV40_9BILA|nr:unnamed protein product [Bursaphelenchus okinawaensis]CAG9112760.1 unnamed protein product [Bursaphelenchus okinawaensis]
MIDTDGFCVPQSPNYRNNEILDNFHFQSLSLTDSRIADVVMNPIWENLCCWANKGFIRFINAKECVNNVLHHKFYMKQQELAQNGIPADPVFGFLCLTGINQKEEVDYCRFGVKTGIMFNGEIGDANEGVYLSRFADVVHPGFYLNDQPIKILICRVLLGQTKKIAPLSNKAGWSMIPDKTKNSHICNDPPLRLSEQPPHIRFRHSQMFVYEYDEAGRATVDRPSTILPLAVASIEITMPGPDLLSIPALKNYNSIAWNGTLQMQTQTIKHVTLHSHFQHLLYVGPPTGLDNFNVPYVFSYSKILAYKPLNTLLNDDKIGILMKCPEVVLRNQDKSEVFVQYYVMKCDESEHFEDLCVLLKREGVLGYKRLGNGTRIFLIPSGGLSLKMGLTNYENTVLHCLFFSDRSYEYLNEKVNIIGHYLPVEPQEITAEKKNSTVKRPNSESPLIPDDPKLPEFQKQPDLQKLCNVHPEPPRVHNGLSRPITTSIRLPDLTKPPPTFVPPDLTTPPPNLAHLPPNMNNHLIRSPVMAQPPTNMNKPPPNMLTSTVQPPPNLTTLSPNLTTPPPDFSKPPPNIGLKPGTAPQHIDRNVLYASSLCRKRMPEPSVAAPPLPKVRRDDQPQQNIDNVIQQLKDEDKQSLLKDPRMMALKQRDPERFVEVVKEKCMMSRVQMNQLRAPQKNASVGLVPARRPGVPTPQTIVLNDDNDRPSQSAKSSHTNIPKASVAPTSSATTKTEDVTSIGQPIQPMKMDNSALSGILCGKWFSGDEGSSSNSAKPGTSRSQTPNHKEVVVIMDPDLVIGNTLSVVQLNDLLHAATERNSQSPIKIKILWHCCNQEWLEANKDNNKDLVKTQRAKSLFNLVHNYRTAGLIKDMEHHLCDQGVRSGKKYLICCMNTKRKYSEARVPFMSAHIIPDTEIGKTFLTNHCELITPEALKNSIFIL